MTLVLLLCPTWTSSQHRSELSKQGTPSGVPCLIFRWRGGLLSDVDQVRKNRCMSDGPPPLHADLEHLVFLLGSWKGKGSGDYPDIEPFQYLEVSTFTHVGKPFIAYAQRTRDATTGEPLHAETGYLRPVNPARAEFVIAQPTGIVEIHDVEVRGTTLLMASSTVVGTPTAKAVTGVARRVSVARDEMQYTVEMAAMGHDMQHHLSATLSRS